MSDFKVESTRLNMFSGEYATKMYENASHFSKVTLDNQETQMATQAFGIAQPDYLPDGMNPTTGGAFGGLLNMIGKYIPNPETGTLEPPVSNFMWVA